MSNENTYGSEQRKHLWFWVFLILVLVLIGADQVYRRALQSQVRRGLDTLKKEGFPVTLTELSHWHGDVSDQENAAIGLLQAADDVILDANSFNRDRWPRGAEELGPDERDSLKEVLTNNAPALELVHAAARLKQSHFPVDYSRGPGTLVPHLAQVKKLVQLLRAEAYLYSEEGQLDAAVRSVLDSVSVSRSLDTEPLLISQLVRAACLSISCSSLERVLSQHALSEIQLNQLSQALHGAEKASPAALQAGFAGEICNGIYCFRASPRELMTYIDSGAADSSGLGTLSQVAFPLYAWTGLRDRDAQFYLSTMRQLLATVQAPLPERLAQATEVHRRAEQQLQQHKLLIYSKMLLPALARSVEKTAESDARLRCAQAALAVELYRQNNQGAVPNDLTQLAPAVPNALPLDPMDGAPLRYRKLKLGYTVYSVGADGQDDGGIEKGQPGLKARRGPPVGSADDQESQATPGKKWSSNKTYDVIFAVER